jgi:hypothetical protein
MAIPTIGSILALVRGVVDDARELIHAEISVARAEIHEQVAAAESAGVAFGAAALFAVVGVVMLCIGLGGGIADLFDWPAWVGYCAMALLLGIAAFFLVRRGRTRLAAIHGLPKTTESLRKSLGWVRGK